MLIDSRSISLDTPDFSMPLSSSQQGHSGMFMVNPTFPVFGKICVPRRKIAAHAYPCGLYAAHPKQSIGHSINNFTFKQHPPPPLRNPFHPVERPCELSVNGTEPSLIRSRPWRLRTTFTPSARRCRETSCFKRSSWSLGMQAMSGLLQNPVKGQVDPCWELSLYLNGASIKLFLEYALTPWRST